MTNNKLQIEFLGKTFNNPFILAAAPPTDEIDMVRRAFDLGWAGAVLKTTNLKGMEGKLSYPLIDSVHDSKTLANIDLTSVYNVYEVVERANFIKKEHPDKIVIISISGSSKDEWKELAKIAASSNADMIECSFSCPHGAKGYMLAQDVKESEKITKVICKNVGNKPIIIKLTPQVVDINEIARSVISAGANAVCIGNTVPGIAGIDLDTFSPKPSVNGVGSVSGISGAGIKPISLNAVSKVAMNNILVSASGGAMNYKDALEFILLGASNVQFATAPMLGGFEMIEDLINGFNSFMEEKGIESIEDFRGKSLEKLKSHSELDCNSTVRAHIDNQKCIRCGKCFTSCNDGGHQAIAWSESKIPNINKDKCVGCGLCKIVCPVKCIKMEDL